MSKRAIHISVRLRRNESSEKLIKRFTRKVKKANIIEDFKKRSRFKKPSEKRREEKSRRLRELSRKKR